MDTLAIRNTEVLLLKTLIQILKKEDAQLDPPTILQKMYLV